MADLKSIVEELEEQGEFDKTTRNPLAQFGNQARGRNLLGAQLLPERMRDPHDNSFTDEDFEIRTVIGQDTTRYSAVEKRSRVESEPRDVFLGELEAGALLTAQQIDSLNRILKRSGVEVTKEAMVSLVERLGIGGLMDKKELQRWEAIVFGQIMITGSGKKERIVNFPNPTGHRFAANGLWSDDAYNPFEDLTTGYQILEEAGHPLRAMFCRGKIWAYLQKNATVSSKVGTLIVNDLNQLETRNSLVERSKIQLYLQSEGFPPFTVYNLDYYTPTGKGYFLPDDLVVMIGSTPKQYELTNEADGAELLLYDTLGYFEVGTAQAQDEAKDVLHAYYHEKKPASIEVEAYGTGVTNIQENEAIVVINEIG